jgi:hypothetical protein
MNRTSLLIVIAVALICGCECPRSVSRVLPETTGEAVLGISILSDHLRACDEAARGCGTVDPDNTSSIVRRDERSHEVPDPSRCVVEFQHLHELPFPTHHPTRCQRPFGISTIKN